MEVLCSVTADVNPGLVRAESVGKGGQATSNIDAWLRSFVLA
jgi:hypothetical protein